MKLVEKRKTRSTTRKERDQAKNSGILRTNPSISKGPFGVSRAAPHKSRIFRFTQMTEEHLMDVKRAMAKLLHKKVEEDLKSIAKSNETTTTDASIESSVSTADVHQSLNGKAYPPHVEAASVSLSEHAIGENSETTVAIATGPSAASANLVQSSNDKVSLPDVDSANATSDEHEPEDNKKRKTSSKNARGKRLIRKSRKTDSSSLTAGMRRGG